LVDNFGAAAVFGNRQLYMDEMMGMIAARRVVNAYAAKKRAKDKYKWAQENPELQMILDDAEIARIEAR